MKILTAIDDGSFLESLQNQLNKFSDITEIVNIHEYDDFFMLARQHQQFDTLFVDKQLMETPRKERYTEIINLFPDAYVIVVCPKQPAYEVWKAFSFGVNGFLFSDENWSLNTNVLRLMIDGQPFLPPTLLDEIPSRYKAGNGFASVRKLTERQIEALRCLAEGLSNREISQKMRVSEATVKLHINALLHRLNVENRTKAVVIAQQIGLI